MGVRTFLFMAAVTAIVITPFSAAPARLEAQASVPAALSGVVSSQAEGKMEGVLVTARREGANFTVTVISDAEGRYSFPSSHVAPGKYAITIRAAGYDLADASPVEIAEGKATTRDLTLQKAKDLLSQLTSTELVNSMTGTSDQKDRLVYTALSCAYCHTFQRIVKSKHTAEEWIPVIKRMQSYYPDGTAASDDGRGRGQKELAYGGSLGNPEGPKVERPPTPGAPWGRFQGTELADYLATINMSGGKTALPYDLKTLPRVKGKATRVIITQWDMPRRDTVSHDSDVDSKGIFWYTDESRQFVGKLDPKTNTITEYPLPSVRPDSLSGARDVVIDKDDNPWFPVRVDGGASLVSKFDAKTQKLTMVDGAFGQFVGLGGDGNIWTGTNIFYRVNTQTMKVDATYDWRKSPNLPATKRISCYQIAADSKGNPWCTGYVGSYIITADGKTGEAKFWPTPTPDAMPRRNRMDAQDRYWFAEYTADKVGMFDTRTEKFQEWPLPIKYTTPYSSSIPDKNGRVYVSSNMTERVSRVDTKTGEVVEYPMPGNFDSKKVTIDRSTDRPTVWMANTRAARIVRVEPLD
jgi:virginiamycin B lyase